MILQLLTHSPVYLYVFLAALIKLPKVYLRSIIPETMDICDSTVFKLCTETSLVLLCKFENGKFVFRMPKHAPSFQDMGFCELKTLEIAFVGDSIISAASSYGPVKSLTETVSRNEVLVAALRCILSHWLHPTIHVAAEKNALEIQAKKIQALEPSAHFVSSLHEGLLHGPLSPLSTAILNPLFCGTGSQSKLVRDCYEFPVPPHYFAPEKNQFEFYNFTMKSRVVIYQLVRDHNLDVDPECLFLNLILHGIDHDGLYEVLNELPLFSIDGTGSMSSYWQAFIFTHAWLKHVDNPLNSDLLSAHLEKPFYRELYSHLKAINPKLSERIVVSCCF